MGAGIPAVQTLLWLLTGHTWWPGAGETIVVIALLGSALLFSLAHLGRKKRLLLALRHIHRSPLSLEVFLAGLILTISILTLVLDGTVSRILWVSTLFLALLLLADIGLVYRLGGQLAWRGATTVSPLVIGLLWGSLFHMAIAEVSHPATLQVAYGLLIIDMVVTIIRWSRLERLGSLGEPRHLVVFKKRRTYMFSRLVLLDLVTCCLLVLLGPVPALLSTTLGVVADRYLFYALAVQHTTESELDRVDSLIRRSI